MKPTGWNIKLKATDGATLNLGKIVQRNSVPIYHYWAAPKERRRDIDAWGIREGVLAHCIAHRVAMLVIYDKSRGMTQEISIQDVLLYASAGKTDKWGVTLNVPLERFTPCARVGTFIPDEVYKIVGAQERVEALHHDVQIEDAPPPQVKPEQGELF